MPKQNQNQDTQSPEVKDEIVVGTTQAKEPQQSNKPKKIDIDRDEMVSLRNVTKGKVIYVSKKTGAEYIWDSYGSEEYLEAGEIITLKTTYPRMLTEPWLVIEHEDLIKYLALDKVYDSLIPLDQLDEFFTWNAEKMDETLKKVPNGIKQLIGEQAKEIVKSLSGYQKQAIESNLNIILD